MRAPEIDCVVLAVGTVNQMCCKTGPKLREMNEGVNS